MTEERRVHADYHSFLKDKYWQKQHFVGPGDFFSSDDTNDMLVAETGSGVVVCMYDPEIHVGGIAHILMPKDLIKKFSKLEDQEAEIIEYAKAPLEKLIKALKNRGAGKKRINIRLSGGASMMNDEFEMGLKNAVFAQNQIFDKGLNLITTDIGGEHCRRVHHFPHTGRMEKFPLRRSADQEALWAREKEYLEKVQELFG